MLDKAILIVSMIYSNGGHLEAMTYPGKDFRAFDAVDCIQMKREEDKIYEMMVEREKNTPDEQGRLLVAVSTECYPVSQEEFAIFSSTFALPD